MKGLIKNELVRQLINPRWLVVIPAALIPAHLNGVNNAQWINISNPSDPILNAWDGVILTFIAAEWTIGLFFMPAFAFIAGNRLIEDMTSGYLSWQIIRANTEKIWMSKIFSVLITALIYSVVYMIIVASYCMTFLPVSLEGSQLTRGALFNADLSPEAIAFYKNVSPFMVLFIRMLFSGLGVGAIISVLLCLTLFIQKNFLPLIITILLGFISPAIFSPLGKMGLSPIARLNFDLHVGFGNIEPQMIFSETIVLWFLLIAFSMYLGKEKIKKLVI